MLIEDTFAYDFDADARLEFLPDGVRCTLVIPLPEWNAANCRPVAWTTEGHS
jgi:hypothetical protein